MSINDRAVSGEIGNARAVICLADGDPDGALAAVRDVLDGIAPVIGYVTVVEAYLLAGAGLSRHEIAAELSVSVNTVSTHIRSSYAKLQVSDRSSAVQRAGVAAASRRALGKPDRKSPEPGDSRSS